MKKIKVIAFDADDTLWVNEPIFTKTQKEFKTLLEPYLTGDEIDTKLYNAEIRNLRLFGYGVKGFMLSMIETAIELTQGKITGTEIQRIIDLGKEMIEHPIEVLPNVEETIKLLQDQYELMVITKGDLFDQESKIARSGLGIYFNKVEIVSEKNEQSYLNIIRKNNIIADEFIMIGNSLKSDILPVCKIGAHAVHIPFHVTWAHELVETHQIEGVAYQELADISLLPELLNSF
ncbi:HAD family hydrolase [Cytophagaceae bacterium DM2B3-1]|uniref:HAD family hydrolase n=1 Tax=Xanthocytophaga flava TaxID=3048013 RepID=A0ABT7CX71_9BACT|nr:HAD family hydrolase [Xanthocytophaga flavus]MDJ1470364.1 HAD family hydrolase [Xanthocytophaga flavus]MDJ1498251.1 HAD family hydrolase [Xanthocytophaga flavus]